MEYSKIKSIAVKNFMGHRDSKVTYDETGVLNFKGYNSSGKSAFLTAVAVALMNLYPQKQTKFIYHGEEYFRIIVTFEDGVSLVRDKYKNGQSLYELYREDKRIFTTKAGNKLTKVDDVPSEIKNYLGLIETQIGYINYQVRRDPMWLIDTTGGENYYSLNEVLRSVELARASSMANSDKNKLQSDIAQIESDRSGVRMQLDSYSTLNEDLLLKLSEKEIFVQTLMNQYDLLYNIVTLVEELDAVRIPPAVERLDDKRWGDISDIQSCLKEILSVSYFPEELIRVDSSQMEAIRGISNQFNDLEDAEKNYFKHSIKGIGTGCLKDVAGIQKIVKEYIDALEEYNKLKKEEKSLINKRDTLLEEADKEGLSFIVCKNCGTMLEVAKVE